MIFEPSMKIYAKNKRAFFDYDIIDKYEAGIVLTGPEVKAVKAGMASLKEGFIKYIDGELWLWNASIQRYRHASYPDSYDPSRSRKLLVHKRELRDIARKLEQARLTAIPLKLFEVRNLIKLEFAVGKGRKKHDKQRRIKEREEVRRLHEEKKRLGIV